jgi:hypothetical protein
MRTVILAVMVPCASRDALESLTAWHRGLRRTWISGVDLVNGGGEFARASDGLFIYPMFSGEFFGCFQVGILST